MKRTLRARTARIFTARQAREVQFPQIFSERSRRIKRFTDIVSAGTLAVAALPLFVLIAILIKLTSRGPLFYSHPRIGRAGRPFSVLKFRTMRVDADNFLRRYLDENPDRAAEWEQNHKLKNDPRVTLAGRFLRRTSLDELPQVWNVLRGDMSMVGPRPIVAEEAPKYGSSFVFYSQVRPGLTGLWQVSGRNDTNYRRRVELDTQYIRNWTPTTDWPILLRTFGAVLKGRGAY